MYNPSSPQATSSYAVHRPSAIHNRLRIPATPSLPNLRRDLKPESDPRPMVSQPASPAIPNAHSPAALQSHIYTAFLERRTADVALHVRGSWHAIYKLHRVVLIQAVSNLSWQRIVHADTYLRRPTPRLWRSRTQPASDRHS